MYENETPYFTNFFNGRCGCECTDVYHFKNSKYFGDTVETYTDQSGKKLATVTHSTNIFGDKIKSMTGPNGEKIQSPKNINRYFRG